MAKKEQNGSSRYLLLLVFVVIIIVGIATAIYLYGLESHSLYFYSDSTTHALASRLYVDSDRPGLLQHLGTVWLPLPHLLLIPFMLIDPLFRSGFAGLIVTLPFHALTSVILYKMIKRDINNRYIPIIGAFLYAFNPNFMYLSLTPMTEAAFMLFFVASAYYFQKWMFDSTIFYSQGQDSKIAITGTNSILVNKSSGWQDLIKSAIFVSLATLCRYEAWILPISLVIIVVVLFAIKNKKSVYYRVKMNTVLILTIFSIISLSGMILWLVWNWYSYGDPFEFSNNPIYSAKAHAARNDNQKFLYLQPVNVLKVYGTTLLYVYGPIILLVALFGYLSSTIFSKDKDKSKRIILYLFLVGPPIFTIVSMIDGLGEMNLFDWYNSRFLILSGPLIVVLTCIFLSKISNRIRKPKLNKVIMVSIIISLFAYQTISPGFTVVTFTDALEDYSRSYVSPTLQAAKFLSTLYDHDNNTIYIVTTGGQQGVIAIESGVPLKNFHSVRDSDSQSPSYRMPWMYTNYFVLSKEPKGDIKKTVDYWMNNKEVLSKFYHKVYENSYYVIYTTNNVHTTDCIQYDASTLTISITCKSSNLTDIFNTIEDTNILSKTGPKSWLLNASIEINNESTFYINSTDTNWLKINSLSKIPHNITAHGNLIIDSVKITGWDLKKNSNAAIDKNGTISRGYILVKRGSGTTNITNSEIGYLGYNHGGSFGLTYYSGAGSQIKNNRIHDLFFGFYSSSPDVNRVTIDSNEFYNNAVYGIDPHSGTHDLIIKNNKVHNNGKHGIICSTDCYNIHIESNNVFNNTNEGIMLYKNVTNSIIQNNIVSYNRDQIALYNSSNENFIFNNSITGGKVGIRINTDSSKNLVRENSIENSDYGIYLLQGASNNIIESNKVINSSEAPIIIQDNDTKGNIFKNNVLIHNNDTDNIIKMENSQNKFVNNSLQNHTQ